MTCNSCAKTCEIQGWSGTSLLTLKYTTNFVVQFNKYARHYVGVSDDLYLAVVRMRVREARYATNLKQEMVAERADLTLRHYQRYEARTKNVFAMSLLTLRRIAQVLNADIAELTREPSEQDVGKLES